MMKTQFLCFGLKEDQRHLQHVNVMTRILITNSCKVSTVTSGIQPEMVRAVEGRGHYLEGVWSWAVSGNTRLQALNAGYLNSSTVDCIPL